MSYLLLIVSRVWYTFIQTSLVRLSPLTHFNFSQLSHVSMLCVWCAFCVACVNDVVSVLCVLMVCGVCVAGCACNELGSTSSSCDIVSGRCLCKNNVVGRSCDQCRVSIYVFFMYLMLFTCASYKITNLHAMTQITYAVNNEQQEYPCEISRVVMISTFRHRGLLS